MIKTVTQLKIQEWQSSHKTYCRVLRASQVSFVPKDFPLGELLTLYASALFNEQPLNLSKSALRGNCALVVSG